MDLGVASRRYLSRTFLGTGSLSSLCSELLQRDLPKTQALRMSAWEEELSAQQASILMTPSIRYPRHLWFCSQGEAII